MAANRNRRSRRALTLLELILALSLSVLVLMAIGMAIDIHYRMLDVRRTNVEESQLARASLRMIADDLRSTVQNSPPDLSGLDAVSANMSGALSSLASTAGLSGQLGGAGGLAGAGGASGGAGTGAGSGSASSGSAQATGGQSGQTPSGSGSAGGSQTGQSSGGSPTSSGASSGASPSQATSTGGTDAEDPEQATATSAVKLYGSPSELRFDISRLPRVDQYQALMAEGNSLRAVDIPSDIKTVVYFVRSDDSAEYGSSDPSPTGMGRGLMRAELDRAVYSFAEMNGDTTSMYSGAKLVADEVTALAFQYWDGLAWTTEWDSDEMGGLPLAVEIVLTIQPTQAMTEAEIAELGAADSTLSPKEQTYRLVVHLPTAISTEIRTLEAEADEVAAAEMPASEESGTTTDSGGATGGSSSGGTSGSSQPGSGQPGSGQPGLGAGGTGPGGFGTGGSDPEGGGRGGRGQEGGKGDRGGKKGGASRGGRGGFGGGSGAPTGGGTGRAR